MEKHSSTIRLSSRRTIDISYWKGAVYFHIKDIPNQSKVTLNTPEFRKLTSQIKKAGKIASSMLRKKHRKPSSKKHKKRTSFVESDDSTDDTEDEDSDSMSE